MKSYRAISIFNGMNTIITLNNLELLILFKSFSYIFEVNSYHKSITEHTFK